MPPNIRECGLTNITRQPPGGYRRPSSGCLMRKFLLVAAYVFLPVPTFGPREGLQKPPSEAQFESLVVSHSPQS